MTDKKITLKNWDIKKFSSFGFFKSGNAFPTKHQGNLSGDYPFFKVSDMNNVENTTHMVRSNNYLSSDISKLLHINIIPKNSIVFAKIGAAIFLERKKIIIKDSCIDNNMMTFIPDHNKSDYKFVYYLFHTIKLGNLVNTTALPSLNAKDIDSLEIKFPKSLDEQTAIAGVLSDVDGLIETLRQLISKKRNIKIATMQQLLTSKKRLLGFDDKWENFQLGNIGKTFGGLSGKGKNDFGHGYGKYIPFLNIMNNNIINTKFLELVDIAQNEKQNEVRKGDLFFNASSETSDELGYCSLLKENIPNLYLNSFCFGFRFYEKDKHDGLFFAYLFRSSVGREHIYLLSQGATRYNLSKANFLKLNISLPKYEEQTAIASILFEMDSELEALVKRLKKTKALKIGMMQELLTGNIRLLKPKELKRTLA